MNWCKEMIKSSTIWVILFFSILLSQRLCAQSYFTISTEPMPALFKQDKPRLFNGPGGEFVVVWRDFRNGDESYFGQLMHEQGDLKGSNFRVISNEAFAFGADGSYASFGHREDAGNFYYRGFFQIYPPTGNHLDPILATEFSQPPDFLGCPAIASFLQAKQDGYLLGDAYNGEIQIRSFDAAGDLVSSGPDIVLPGGDALGFAMAATWDGAYAIFWIGPDDYTFENAAVYASFFDANHQNVADSVKLGRYGNESCDVGTSMRAITLSDSSFQLFYTISDTLWNIQVDGLGNVLQDFQHIPIGRPLDVPETARVRTKFALSNISDNGFSIIIFAFYRWFGTEGGSRFQTSKFDFSASGQKVGETVLEKQFPTISEIYNIHRRNREISLIPESSNNDIYVYTFEQSTIIDSVKLNDDISGANHTDPTIIPAPDDQFLVSWLEEDSTRKSRLMDANGTFLTEELNVSIEAGNFFPSGEYLTFWRSTSNNPSVLGYRIYSKDWQIIAEQPIAQRYGTTYWLRVAADIVDNDTFIILLQDSTELRLAKVNKGEGVTSDVLVTEGVVFDSRRVEMDKDGTVWALWRSTNSGTFVQLFDLELNWLSTVSDIPNVPLTQFAFLPNGRLAYIRRIGTPIPEMGHYLIVRDTSSDGTEIKVNVEDYYVDQVKLFSVSDKTLLMTYDDDGGVWYQSFDAMANAIVGKTAVYETGEIRYLESSAALGDQTVMFAWSDAVKPGNGFDILGRSIPQSTITNIKSKPAVPSTIQFFPNYPNPFNPGTEIRYELPEEQHVKLTIYNVLGQRIKTLVDKVKEAGAHSITWYGTDERGQPVPSSVYFYRFDAGVVSGTKKMILMR